MPKHQNKFAFKHNPHSRLTLAIASIPATAGCCPKCTQIIEWRRKYRKYKPLTKPRKCTGCSQLTLRLAYHSLCVDCVGERTVCAKCGVGREEAARMQQELEDLNKQIDLLVNTKGSVPGFSERERRSMLRELLRDKARLMEITDEDAAEELAELDAAAAAAESGAVPPAKAKAAGPKKKKKYSGGGGAAAGGGEGEEEGEEGGEDEAGGEERDDGEEGEEGEEEEEEEGEDYEEEEEEEEELEEEKVVEVKRVEKSGGGGGKSSGKIQPGAFGSSPDDEGLVDPSIFSRALKEAQRRARELGM